MLKENKRTWIITNIVVVLPVLIGVIFWNRLPDVMATHFGMNNAANGFSNKAMAVFGLPAFLLELLATRRSKISAPRCIGLFCGLRL